MIRSLALTTEDGQFHIITVQYMTPVPISQTPIEHFHEARPGKQAHPRFPISINAIFTLIILTIPGLSFAMI